MPEQVGANGLNLGLDAQRRGHKAHRAGGEERSSSHSSEVSNGSSGGRNLGEQPLREVFRGGPNYLVGFR
jgi:hypothetical protein